MPEVSINGKRPREDDLGDDEDDVPLAKRRRLLAVLNAQAEPAVAMAADEKKAESSDDDLPLAQRMAAKKASPGPKAKDDGASSDDVPIAQRMAGGKKGGKAVAAKAEKSDSEDDLPLAQRAAAVVKAVKKEESDSDDVPLAKRAASKKSKKESSSSSSSSASSSSSDDSDDGSESGAKKKKGKKGGKKGGASKKSTKSEKKTPAKKSTKAAASKKSTKTEDGEEGPKKGRKKKEEDFVPTRKWWEEPPLAKGKKWRTFEHSGITFPPAYVPHKVKMLYNGDPLDLDTDEEEPATWFAQMMDHASYGQHEVFTKNFFTDWRTKYLKKSGKDKLVKDWSKCNFRPINLYLEQKREQKKNRSKEEKDAEKKTKAEMKEKFGYVMIDGFKEEIGNFVVEPPGLFRGRGQHPKMGTIKPRTMPEDVTLNLSKGAKVPPCPLPGRKWGGIVHKDDALWIASWVEKVQGNNKYVQPAASSSLKQRSDRNKFDKARKLQLYVGKIREDIQRALKSDEMKERQLATAVWLIDVLALRVGGEKGEDEADTVGCCSLRVEHVRCLGNQAKEGEEEKLQLHFKFLGKDSMEYNNVVTVPKNIYKNIKRFAQDKKDDEQLFDHLTTTTLNKYLKSHMPGLSAKVFRTYNASITLEIQLRNTPVKGDRDAKRVAYTQANREVAILCNHQRSLPKKHGEQVEGMKKKLEDAQEKVDEIVKEIKDAKKEGNDRKVSQLKDKKAKAEARVKKLESDLQIKDETATVALGTSKINYMDPRITWAWCKKHGMDIKDVFNKALIKKFPWAEGVDGDWTFIYKEGEEPEEAAEDEDDDE